MSISVVLPSYNEAGNIVPLMYGLGRALGSRLTEIIVVDDDSPDRTWQIAETAGIPTCRVLRRIGRRGLASALAEGIADSHGAFIVWMDCDLGMSADDVPRLVDALGTCDIAIGSRYTDGGSDMRGRMRKLSSRALNGFARFVLGPRLHDYTSGFAAAKRDVFASVPISASGYGDYFIEWAYRCIQKGFQVKEIGYTFRSRAHGRSKSDPDFLTFLRLGFQYGLRIIRTRLS